MGAPTRLDSVMPPEITGSMSAELTVTERGASECHFYTSRSNDRGHNVFILSVYLYVCLLRVWFIFLIKPDLK